MHPILACFCSYHVFCLLRIEYLGENLKNQLPEIYPNLKALKKRLRRKTLITTQPLVSICYYCVCLVVAEEFAGAVEFHFHAVGEIDFITVVLFVDADNMCARLVFGNVVADCLRND